MWQFDRKGYISLEPNGLDEEYVFEIAVEAGADDIEFGDELIEIYTGPANFAAVQKALEEADIATKDIRLTMVPKRTMTLDEDETLRAMRLIDALEELDDVQEVHSNLEITDAIIAKYEGEL
jgi:transcriptional/translational regulatory protein YebC/TACO1